MNKEEYADLVETDGLLPGYPFSGGLIDGEACDREACAASTCPNCGRVGMDHHPYTTPRSCGYRAFAVCPGCGWAYEF